MKLISIRKKINKESIHEFIINKKKVIFLIFILLIFFSLGVLLGFNIKNKKIQEINIENLENEEINNLDFSPFWKTWNLIDKKYPDSSKTNNQNRIYGAISGLVSSLDDPYSVFFDPEETKAFQEEIQGSFSGVGMEVGIKDKMLTVISPLKDTPAYKAGIKSGDKILKIDKVSTFDLSIENAVKLIRGEKNTPIVLTILHTGDKNSKEISIMRDIIEIPTIDTELRNDGIFIIKLYSFSANSTTLFRKAIKEFYESNSDKLLLDLRGNPGGYLDAPVNIASWFLPAGKPVVIEDYGNNMKRKFYRSDGYNIFNDNLKFVILIDSGSASASEILAGAMQDYGKAKLVGVKSFGKGSVQEVIDITPDTVLKITVAKWLTPNGNSISEKGLTPDYKVEITQKDIDNKIDPQLNKALYLLNNW